MTRFQRAFQMTLAIFLMAATLEAQQPLPITRVLLAKNGMAYIVRSGQISAPLSLTFHPEDMNDVLKSFTAWNPDNGSLYSVGYTTGIPSSHMLGRYPFNLTGDIGLGSFLAQVKGATVRLDVGGKTLEGKLLAVQQTDHVLQQQTSASDYRLTVLLADGSLQTVWLSETRSVEFPDPALRDQLKQYLEVLSEGRQDVTRQVSVYPSGGGGPLRVAYLQQFPLWKTSYRIDLGAKDSRLQGWAQIDNPTGESWENVEVSLLSGSPVSFVMNLYQPLFTSRASVAVPGGQVAAPRQYESAVSQAGIVLDEKQIAALPMVGNDPLALIATLPGYRANPMGHELDALGGLPSSMAKAVRDGLSVGDNFRADQGFQPAQATEVRDFFEYRFPFPVQLASRQSALLPFLQKTAPTERLSIYNASADRGNPRLGVRLENNTDVPLEPGPITFFEEGRYAGEAVLAYLPRSEKRLVSYGVDYDIQVAAKPKSSPETTVRITAAKGVVTLFKESLLTTTYEIRNKGTQPKTLIVEHARTGARRLNDETEPWETTDNYYRFRVKLAPGETTELTPREIVSRSTQIRVGGLTREQFAATFSNSETPQALRESIGAIIDLQERVATLTRERTEVEAKIARLFPDQNRMRNNLNALRSTAEEQALRSRYLGELTRQEDEIAALRARSDALEQEVVAAQADLADRIEQLAWDEPSKN